MTVTSFDDDLLELRPFAQRLEEFIEVERHFVDGGLVIALTSKFGTGKTTFLQMWKSDLDKRKENPETPLVISLNAWESDYYGDPLFALVECLKMTGKSASKLIEAAKDVGWYATAIGGQIVKKTTGIDPIAAGEHAVKKKASREGDIVKCCGWGWVTFLKILTRHSAVGWSVLPRCRRRSVPLRLPWQGARNPSAVASVSGLPSRA